MTWDCENHCLWQVKHLERKYIDEMAISSEYELEWKRLNWLPDEIEDTVIYQGTWLTLTALIQVCLNMNKKVKELQQNMRIC